MKRLLTLLTLLLVLVVPGLANAANVPVYLEGEPMGLQAVQRGGHYYVPLRPMLELFGFEPQWHAAEQKLSAVVKDNDILYVWPGKKDFEMDRVGSMGGYHYFISDGDYPAALLIGGQVYMESYSLACALPLQEYVPEAGGRVEYTYYYSHDTGYDLDTMQELDLNTHTGQLTLAGEELATLELPFYDTHWGDTYIEGRRTPGGNYLFWYGYDGWKIREEGYTNKTLRAAYFINAGSGAAQRVSAVDYDGYGFNSVYSRLPREMQLPGEIWLSGDDGIWQMEDKPVAEAGAETGTVCLNLLPKLQALGLPLQRAYCYWTDGRYMLLGDMQRFALYDLQANKGLDLMPLLLTDGSADLLNQHLQRVSPQVYDEAGLAAFWRRLNAFPTPEFDVSQPWLRFDRCQENIFYFTLYYESYANAPHRNQGEYVISLGLEKLKEAL